MAVRERNSSLDIDERHGFDANQFGLSINYIAHFIIVTHIVLFFGPCENIVMPRTIVVHSTPLNPLGFPISEKMILWRDMWDKKGKGSDGYRVIRQATNHQKPLMVGAGGT